MENENLEESLDQLKKALEAGHKNIPHPVLQVEDEMPRAIRYLNDKAFEKLNIKATANFESDIPNGNPVEQATFFGVAVPSDKLELGIEKMADIANDLANKGLISSTLTPITSIKLAHLAGQVEATAVFFFPLVPIDKVEEIQKEYEYSMGEGDQPKILGSLELELPPGEFYAVTRISHVLSMVKDFSHDINGYLLDEINEYLAVLPKGTRFLGANVRAITDLSIPYELRFSNPLLQDVKRVELDHMRMATVINDHLEQFNLFLGIRYYGKDNKRLYVRK